MPRSIGTLTTVAVLSGLLSDGLARQTFAQGVKVDGAIPGTVRKAPGSVDPRGARLLSAAAFRQLDVSERVGIMAAWGKVGATNAGDGILPLVEAALLDADANVRGHAINVLNRLQMAANVQRAYGKPLTTDHLRYPPLFDTLVTLLRHPDPGHRWGVVTSLAAFDPVVPCKAEQALLTREAEEPVNRVKAQIVRGLAACARRGSVRSLALVSRALDDGEPTDVQTSAIGALRTVQLSNGPERLLLKLSASSPLVRASAARTLMVYRDDARKQREKIETALAAEVDTSARKAMRELLDSLDRQ